MSGRENKIERWAKPGAVQLVLKGGDLAFLKVQAPWFSQGQELPQLKTMLAHRAEFATFSHEMPQGRISVSVTFHFVKPTNLKAWQQKEPVKETLWQPDVITSLIIANRFRLWADDAQISELVIRKFHGSEEDITIEVKEMAGYA